MNADIRSLLKNKVILTRRAFVRGLKIKDAGPA